MLLSLLLLLLLLFLQKRWSSSWWFCTQPGDNRTDSCLNQKKISFPPKLCHTGSVVPRAPCRVELRPCAAAASDSANGKWRGSAGSANAFHLLGLFGQLDRRRMSEVGKAGPKVEKDTKRIVLVVLSLKTSKKGLKSSANAFYLRGLLGRTIRQTENIRRRPNFLRESW